MSKPRVLVWGFSNNRAGTESVVSNYVKCLSDKMVFDVMSYEPTPNYNSLFECENSLITVPARSESFCQYKRFVRHYFDDLAEQYDAVWCNLNSYSNIDILRYSNDVGIKRRILHAHNSMPVGTRVQRILHRMNQRKAISLATDYWACSKKAGDYFFGSNSYIVLPNAIDYSRYSYNAECGLAYRSKLGVPDGCLFVGTAGRLCHQKNLFWIIEFIESQALNNVDVVCAIAGEGELADELKRKVKEKKLSDRILLLGSIKDISEYYSALDVFLLPSLFEGLPVALLEAQANGLPCLVSDTVSTESSICDNCFYLPLNDFAVWGEMMRRTARVPFNQNTPTATRFSLSTQADRLYSLFTEGEQ